MPEASIRAIDCHNHYTPSEVLAHLRSLGDTSPIPIERSEDGGERVQLDGRWFPVQPEQYDNDRRRRDLERMGVTSAVLSPTPWLLAYRLPAQSAAALCRRTNEAMAAAVASSKHGAMGIVPLQDPTEAAAVLREAGSSLRLVAIEIGCHVGDLELDDPSLAPFWDAAEEEGMPLYLHPVGSLHRLSRYYLANLIGVPVDTTIAGASLIFGGVLAKRPGLRVLLSHGGGALPYLLGRWDHGFEVRPEGHVHISDSPRAYLDQVYFDSVTHDPKSLRFLVELAGAANVVLGSDYPFDMAERDPVGGIRAAALGPDNEQAVLEANAVRLFRLPDSAGGDC